MIVKMKFLSISGPKNDIDRVCEVYLSKYEMQLENAAAELKTTDNLQPFVEVNPYKEPLAKAEQFSALLADEDQRIDVSMNQEDMLNLIRDVNHDYLDLVEKKELTKKRYKRAIGTNIFFFFSTVLIAGIMLFAGDPVQAAEAAGNTASNATGFGYLAAALSTGLSCVGGGIAVASAASAALGAISEDSSALGKSLIFVGLAEGVCLYGLIISFMILGKL